MKKLIISLFVFTSLLVHAQSDKFITVMQKNLAQFDSCKTIQDYKDLSASFERIGDAEKTQWLPYYYSGLSLTRAGWIISPTDRDANSEKINGICDKAESIQKNSEIYCVRNMSASQQMQVDPQNRWMTFGKEAKEDLEKAKQADPNNPRIYYLEGMSTFYTPVAYGGGKDAAKPLFAKSVELYKTFVVKPLYPNWGQKMAVDMLSKCQ